MRKLFVSAFSLLTVGGWLGAEAFAQTPAVMTNPANGSTLSAPSVTFQWTMGVGATDHWLYVGTAQNQANIFGGEVGVATSQVVSGIPNGTIYVRLWTRIGGTWWFNDYIFTASIVGDDYPWKSTASDSVNPYTHFYTRECTDFVAWRMNRDAGHTTPSAPWFTDWMPNSSSLWGNASNWKTHAQNVLGYRVDSSPAVGAVAYFSYGHVAYVESVNGDGTVNVSEYNYPSESNHYTTFAYGYRTGVANVTAFIHILR